jgi:hypothetical protein
VDSQAVRPSGLMLACPEAAESAWPLADLVAVWKGVLSFTIDCVLGTSLKQAVEEHGLKALDHKMEAVRG